MSGQLGSWAGIPASIGAQTATVNPLAIASNVADYRAKMNDLNKFQAQQQAGQAYLDSIDPETGMPNTQKLASSLQALGKSNPLIGMVAPGEQQDVSTTQQQNQISQQSTIKTAGDALGLQSSYYHGGADVLNGLRGEGLTGQQARQELMTKGEEAGLPTGLLAQWAGQIPDGPDADNALFALSRQTATLAQQSDALAPKFGGAVSLGGSTEMLTDQPGGTGYSMSPVSNSLSPQIANLVNPQTNQTQATVVGGGGGGVSGGVGVGGGNALLEPGGAQPSGAQALGGQAQPVMTRAPVAPVQQQPLVAPLPQTPYTGGGVLTPQQVTAGAPQVAPAPAPTAVGGNVLGVSSMSPGQTAMANQGAGYVQGLIQSQQSMAGNLAQLTELNSSLSNTNTGPLADVLTPVRNSLAEIGLFPQGQAGQYDTNTKLMNAIATNSLPANLGHGTDFKLQAIEAANANPDNSKEGNQMVVSYGRGILEANNLSANLLEGTGVAGNPDLRDAQGNLLSQGFVQNVSSQLNPSVPAFMAMDAINQKEFLRGLSKAQETGFVRDYNVYQAVSHGDAKSEYYPQWLRENYRAAAQ